MLAWENLREGTEAIDLELFKILIKKFDGYFMIEEQYIERVYGILEKNLDNTISVAQFKKLVIQIYVEYNFELSQFISLTVNTLVNINENLKILI